MWEEFEKFLATQELRSTPAERAASRPRLEQSLRRELARRHQGDAAAARVALDSDPVFQRALEVMNRARAPRDVFAAAAPAGRVSDPRETASSR
jgi:hypothetical protein